MPRCRNPGERTWLGASHVLSSPFSRNKTRRVFDGSYQTDLAIYHQYTTLNPCVTVIPSQGEDFFINTDQSIVSSLIVRVMRVSPRPWRPVSKRDFFRIFPALPTHYISELCHQGESAGVNWLKSLTNIASVSLFGNPLCGHFVKTGLALYGWYVSYSN